MGDNSQAGHVGFKTQAVKGTYSDPGASAPDNGFFVRTQSGAMGSERSLITPSPEIGGNRDPASAELGTSYFTATYVMYGRPDALPTFLYGVLGAVADSAAGSGATLIGTHVANTADTVPWISIEEQLGAGYEHAQYVDAKVDTLTLETGGANSYLNVTAAMTAVKGTWGTTPTDLEDQIWDTAPMVVGTNVHVTLGGTPIPAKDVKLEIKNNLDATNLLLGSLFLGSLDEKQRAIQATITVRPEDSTFLRQAVMGASGAVTPQGQPTVEALSMTFTTYEHIGSTSTAYSLTIAIPVCVIDPFKVTVQGDDPIENSLVLDAFRPVAATDIITATVVNHQTLTA